MALNATFASDYNYIPFAVGALLGGVVLGAFTLGNGRRRTATQIAPSALEDCRDYCPTAPRIFRTVVAENPTRSAIRSYDQPSTRSSLATAISSSLIDVAPFGTHDRLRR